MQSIPLILVWKCQEQSLWRTRADEVRQRRLPMARRLRMAEVMGD